MGEMKGSLRARRLLQSQQGFEQGCADVMSELADVEDDIVIGYRSISAICCGEDGSAVKFAMTAFNQSGPGLNPDDWQRHLRALRGFVITASRAAFNGCCGTITASGLLLASRNLRLLLASCSPVHSLHRPRRAGR
jgi:hypothetical protein